MKIIRVHKCLCQHSVHLSSHQISPHPTDEHLYLCHFLYVAYTSCFQLLVSQFSAYMLTQGL